MSSNGEQQAQGSLSSNKEQQAQRYLPRIMPEVHLRDYIAILLRHITLEVIVLLVCVALGVITALRETPEYKASLQVKVRQLAPAELGTTSTDYASRNQELATYCHIIKGAGLAKNVVAEVEKQLRKDLGGDPEEKVVLISYAALGLSKPKPGPLARVKGWFARSVVEPAEAIYPPSPLPTTMKTHPPLPPRTATRSRRGLRRTTRSRRTARSRP